MSRTDAPHTISAPNGPARGSLSIIRSLTPDHPAAGFETFITVFSDGSIVAFNGHVDLGTGIGTALTQIVAEELDVVLSRVTIVLGDTSRVPNQGATIASETIQITAVPLRIAAAQARAILLDRAADHLQISRDHLTVDDGIVRGRDNRSVSYGELVAGATLCVELRDDVVLKAVDRYRIVGQPVARIDIPAKVTGEFVYVHDVRVPDMLHGRVVRPPYAGVDAGDFVGTSLLAIDEDSVRAIPGIIAIVRIADFVGIVADREENAIRAAERLKITWKPTPTLASLDDIDGALRANPATPRVLLDTQDVDTAIAAAERPMKRTYVWPFQMHASIGPSCAVADCGDETVRVWSGTQNPHVLRADLARLLDIPEQRIDVVRLEAAGCYGRNCADDVTADAALLSRAVGRPVRVQLTREQEHVWEPKGAAQLIDVNGGLRADGSVAAYDFVTRYPSNGAPTLALLLTGAIAPVASIFEMGDRTAIPPYAYGAMRVVAHDMPPIVRASWLRGVSALPNTFAHESYIDELATEAGVDPVAYRLRYLTDTRAIDLVTAVAERASWTPRPAWTPKEPDGDVLRGRGFAYALYVHSKFPGYGAAWSAWVADVAVNTSTGDVSVTRVVVGQDSGLMINPDGVRHQIHGNVIQSTSRTLRRRSYIRRQGRHQPRMGRLSDHHLPDVPKIDVLLLPRPDQPPLASANLLPCRAPRPSPMRSSTRPGYDSASRPSRPNASRPVVGGGEARTKCVRETRCFGRIGGDLRDDCSTRGDGVPMAAGDCADPQAGRVRFLGVHDCARRTACLPSRLRRLPHIEWRHRQRWGRPLETPFGLIYSTNITPDPDTGIGAWSYPAFERAMRHGIHRDGRHLYPAFPYTHFAATSDADLQALYAYLMAQQPVQSVNRDTALAFPFNIRPLMAGWNLLFHKPKHFEARPDQSEIWNRGAYLVEGLGHCGACHSPRNLLGAEKSSAHLAGRIR